jgi:hypothetical protein
MSFATHAVSSNNKRHTPVAKALERSATRSSSSGVGKSGHFTASVADSPVEALQALTATTSVGDLPGRISVQLLENASDGCRCGAVSSPTW